MRSYEEGAMRLVVEPPKDGETTWTVFTQVCEADGIYYEDESIADVEAESLTQAREQAVVAALLAGYAPAALQWTRSEPRGRIRSMLQIKEDN